ncbi:MAG TPA: hypothetical protein VNT27_06650 [Propionibacteriaceae bacterium]|nr:hypothetical protein [Propionibacteriaceae bacterium]
MYAAADGRVVRATGWKRDHWSRDSVPAFVYVCLIYIGGDGAAEGLAYDMRAADPPLVLVNYASEGWSEGFYQASSFTTFLEVVAERGWDFHTRFDRA